VGLVAARLRQNNAAAVPSPAQLEPQVLERLIAVKVQMTRAEALGITVDELTLDNAMRQLAADNGTSLGAFREQLLAEGLSYERLREQIRAEITLSRLHRREVADRIQISEQEIDEVLAMSKGVDPGARQGPRFRLRHILLRVSETAGPEELARVEAEIKAIREAIAGGADFAQTAVARSQAQDALEGGDLGWRTQAEMPTVFAEQAVAMQAGEVRGPVRSGAGFHLLKLEQVDTGDAQAGRGEIEARLKHILVRIRPDQDADAAEARAREILAELNRAGDNAPARFVELAAERSEDPNSATKGGDLGWLRPEALPEALTLLGREAPEGLWRQPVRSDFGWHVVWVEGRRTAPLGTAEERDRVRQMIGARKFDEQIELYVRQLRDQAYVRLVDGT